MDGGVAKRLIGRGAWRHEQPRTRQRGAVLFLGLALLMAITAAALSAAQTTSLELRMSRNSHDAALAFHAADAALREAEAWLEADGDATDARVHPGGTGYGSPPAWRDPAVWAAHGRAAGTRLPGVVEAPRSLIEWITTHEDTALPPPRPLVDVFRVTARGIGSSPATVVRLQSTYARTRDADEAGRLSWVELES